MQLSLLLGMEVRGWSWFAWAGHKAETKSAVVKTIVFSDGIAETSGG